MRAGKWPLFGLLQFLSGLGVPALNRACGSLPGSTGPCSGLVLELKVERACLQSCPRGCRIFFFFNKFILFFYYFWLGWAFVAAHGLSLVAVSVGCSSLWCAGFSLPWFLLLRSMGSRYVGFNSCSAQAQ